MKNHNFKIIIIGIVGFLLSPLFVLAKEKAKKNVVLDFDNELITGANDKPDLFFIFQKKQFKFKKLIKLREDFIPEMKNTLGDVQKIGSGN